MSTPSIASHKNILYNLHAEIFLFSPLIYNYYDSQIHPLLTTVFFSLHFIFDFSKGKFTKTSRTK